MLVAVAASGCMTEAAFDQMAEKAATCSAGEPCALAGHPKPDSCTCPRPVRSSEAANIDAAAQQIACFGKMVKCVSYASVYCDAGLCVGERG